MSISGIRIHSLIKTLITYVAVTIFCVIFNIVYGMFSHDVQSYYMEYMFLYPLCGGIMACIGLIVVGGKNIRVAFNFFNAGIATLTIGSCLQGIFEISLSDAQAHVYYYIGGWILVFLGIMLYIGCLFKKNKDIA